MNIKVLLADNHALFQYSLSKFLEKEQDIDIVGQTEDGCNALELVRELSPDVMLMDISMPNLNGVETTRTIVKDYPHLKVIWLSMHLSNAYVRQMLLAGASGYLLKDCALEELVKAIKTVVGGKTYIDQSISPTAFEDLLENR